jgi:hypothetical protein
LDNKFSANGNLYLDDGETFGFQKGEFLYVEFSFNEFELTIKPFIKEISASLKFFEEKLINSIEIFGFPNDRKTNKIVADEHVEVKFWQAENNLRIEGLSLEVNKRHSILIN